MHEEPRRGAADAETEAAVEAAFGLSPRSRHLPPDQRRYAVLDRALPIGWGQTNSQPTTVRAMLRALGARPGHRVLDVGSGSGWTTVLLAHLVGPGGHVVGVERVPVLTAWGRLNVETARTPWARVVQSVPGEVGCTASAPYDRILVSAAGDEVPADLLRQLAPGGVMVLPVDGELLRVRAGSAPERLGPYAFVPLVVDPPSGEGAS